MFPSSLIPFGVIAEVRGVEPELLGNERTQLSGRLFAFPEDASGESQVTEHDGEAQTIGIAAASIDQRQVVGA